MKNICENCGEETERDLVECPICKRKICWKCNHGVLCHPYKSFVYMDNICADCYTSWEKMTPDIKIIMLDAYKNIDEMMDVWKSDMQKKSEK